MGNSMKTSTAPSERPLPGPTDKDMKNLRSQMTYSSSPCQFVAELSALKSKPGLWTSNLSLKEATVEQHLALLAADFPYLPMPMTHGLDNDFLAVLCDYPSPDISPPIFRRGEKLRVISDEGGWWRAISLSTGRESYIPGMCVAKVYHGWLFEGLGRDKAEELLLLPDTKIGSFMIRESETKKGFYSLSVRHRQVKHYRIFRLPNNWYYISPRLTFQCLEDLVNHYSEVADGLCCVLTTPCLTQCTSANVERASGSPVVMRQKNFNWKNVARVPSNPDGEANHLEMDESLFSYGLRESIASYLSLAGEDGSSFTSDRKKKSHSLIYAGNKRKSALLSAPQYFED